MALIMRILLLALMVLGVSPAAVAQAEGPVVAAPVGVAPARVAQPWAEADARALLAATEASSAEGLNPARYDRVPLEAALQSGDQAQIDAGAKALWLAIARDYAAGAVPESARRGWKGPGPRADLPWLLERMDAAQAGHSVQETLLGLLPTHAHYAALKTAYAEATDPAYRRQLEANLERWRWTPRLLGQSFVMANIPAFELQYWEGTEPVATHRTIVGRPKTPTPILSAPATGVVVNPPWNIPQSIVKESVGALIRNSPSAARAKGYKWQTVDGKLIVQQAPGANNSLGKIKIDMPNQWAIYLHDTPARALFRKPGRALSHGCVRTEGVVLLAGRMTGMDPVQLLRQGADGKTRIIPLPQQVPVHIVYFTIAPGIDGKIRDFADIYGRDATVLSALEAKSQPVAEPKPQPVAEEAVPQAVTDNRPA